MVVARVVDQSGGRVGSLEDAERDPVGRKVEGLPPVLELHESLYMQASALRVLEDIDGNPRQLQDVDAGDPGAGLEGDDAVHVPPQSLGELVVARRKVDG